MNQHIEHPNIENQPTFPHELECVVCGHTWHRRIDKLPKVCPRCKHYNWRKTNWETEKDVKPVTRTK